MINGNQQYILNLSEIAMTLALCRLKEHPQIKIKYCRSYFDNLLRKLYNKNLQPNVFISEPSV
jgi:hypothetical protein